MSEEALADSYVGLTARVWIADPSRADFLAIRSEHIRKLKARFDEKDIEVPFPAGRSLGPGSNSPIRRRRPVARATR